jgi:two-component system, NarL family, response regulator LiaR
MRVVVADDNPKWLLMLASIVEAKYEVVSTAIDGKSALQSISQAKPDVAVLDLEMPGLNGLQVTREIMSNGQRPPVVICSVDTTQEVVEAAREAGAAGYVFKHCCTRDLVAAIEAVAGGRVFFPSTA